MEASLWDQATHLIDVLHSGLSAVEVRAIPWASPGGGKAGLASHKGRLCTAV